MMGSTYCFKLNERVVIVTKYLSAVALLFLCLLPGLTRAEPPDGLANISYSEDSLFEVISYLLTVRHGEEGLPDNPTYSIMVDGHIVVACDEGAGVLDLTDPYDVKLASTYWYDNYHSANPEYDNWGLTTGYGGIHAVRMDSSFLEIVDYSDLNNPQIVSTVELPEPYHLFRPNGSHWAWGYPIATAWQAPYLYSAMREVGIDIIDVHDIRNPRVVKRFSVEPDVTNPGNFFVIGNLLFAGRYRNKWIGAYDISDPENPQLLFSERDSDKAKGWQIWVNGNKLFRSGDKVHVWDVSDPTNFEFLETYETNSGCEAMAHGHCSSGGTDTQDEFLFLGGSHFGVYKWSLETGDLIGHSGPFHKPGSTEKLDYYDTDYPNVVGNLVVAGSEDHLQGVFVIPHQAEPDNTPPEVNMVVPKNGDTNQATTSRVGLTFTDAIDPASVTTETFIVRESGGSALPGKYSMYRSIVNFSPDQPLETNKTYEVVVPAGGITDYMGNAAAETFSSNFSTGDAVSVRPEPAKKGSAGPRIAPSLQVIGTGRQGFQEARDAQLFTIRGSRVPMNKHIRGPESEAGVSRGVYVISRRK